MRNTLVLRKRKNPWFGLVMSKILRTSPLLAAFLFASCGGGGSGSGGNAASQQDLRISVCSLGCNGGTCSVRQLSVNSDLVFTFNDNVLPSSVDLTSIALVNLTTGGSPTGKFLVDGSKVTFRPSYEDSSEGVSFGFEDSNTYSLVIAAAPGDSAVVRSRAGRPNTSRLSCTFETIGIRDYVPGPPAVTITPSEDNPPLERSFDVVLSFNDLVRSSQLLNPNGTSPTVSVSLVSIDGFGNEVVFPLDGTFLFQNDIDNRTTSLTFQPLGALPTGQNGTRWVRIDVSNQITDLVGNRLVNSGSFKVPLPEVSGATGSISEDFATTAKLDPLKSAPTLWEGTGFLDSGLDPVSGQHPGGGSGVFGSPDLDGFVFDTGAAPAAGMVHSELLGIDLPVSDGVMMFSSLELGFGDETAAMGTRPLRLFVRGSADIRGTLDFSGADGETNFGMYRPEDERLSYNKLNGAPEPPTADMQALLGDPLENLGGAGGEAALGGGGGGHGGLGWHQLPGYYNDAKDGYFGEHSTTGPAADDTRYLAGYGAEPAVGVHGQNGGRVGGQDAQGAPLGAAAAQIIPDALEGSGMGTWAWPPKSNRLPITGQVGSGAWVNGLDGLDLSGNYWSKFGSSTFFYRNFSIARARGGGGGGYWTDGERGDVHDEDSIATDSYNEFLSANEPNFDRYNTVLGVNHHWNGDPLHGGDVSDPADRENWPDFVRWDNQASNVVAEGIGGQYTPLVGGNPVPYFTLDPAQGYLRGGAGGGGAGNSQHGSFNFELSGNSLVQAEVESYRDSDGCGGGVQLQIARDLNLLGTIDVSGGDGGSAATRVSTTLPIDTIGFFTNRVGSAGGGGGAGGGLLLQVGGTATFTDGGDVGTIDLNGGQGGLGAVGNDGGVGGIGVLRFESSNPFTLADANGIVSPIESYDLATRPEYSLTGENQGAFQVDLSGSIGDQTVPKAVGGGNAFFNGNSTGIASDWYEADPELLFLIFDSWQVEIEYSNGTGSPQTITYNDANPTGPGVTPVWVAFQTGYGFEENGVIEVVEGSEYGWVIPGYNTVTGGDDELQAAPASTRLLRYQLVFDQDLVSSLIGNAPSAYFRVTGVSVDWRE